MFLARAKEAAREGGKERTEEERMRGRERVAGRGQNKRETEVEREEEGERGERWTSTSVPVRLHRGSVLIIESATSSIGNRKILCHVETKTNNTYTFLKWLPKRKEYLNPSDLSLSSQNFWKGCEARATFIAVGTPTDLRCTSPATCRP